ncbi:MAG: type VI secretion-associated protein [Rhizobiales bacterium 65-79]|jgi:type VI secretion system protein ImpM|nr:type VI secretion system-associated protein TagF [Hyphomicrobiales bacterium]OJU02204.1 MAG: type VI secretion-associated protein [Rhizobiales bacterium 65-79]
MPAEHLTPGFFGKIPATGDFVARRLPRDFVRMWDRLAARHLVRLLELELWPTDRGLRFLLNIAGRGTVAGVAVPSSDRVGRRFPLTASAPCPGAGPDTIADASEWFGQVEETLATVRDDGGNADRLAETLAGLPFPRLPRSTDGTHGKALWLWTRNTPPVEADPEAPQGALDRLFAPVSEAG